MWTFKFRHIQHSFKLYLLKIHGFKLEFVTGCHLFWMENRCKGKGKTTHIKINEMEEEIWRVSTRIGPDSLRRICELDFGAREVRNGGASDKTSGMLLSPLLPLLWCHTCPSCLGVFTMVWFVAGFLLGHQTTSKSWHRGSLLVIIAWPYLMLVPLANLNVI